MKFPNQEGTPVDPVPFFVISGMAFATCFSFGPAYFMALGLRLQEAVAASGGIFLSSVVASYHRFVWTVRPDLRGEIPADVRFYRLAMMVFVGIAVVVLLALPLVV